MDRPASKYGPKHGPYTEQHGEHKIKVKDIGRDCRPKNAIVLYDNREAAKKLREVVRNPGQPHSLKVARQSWKCNVPSEAMRDLPRDCNTEEY